MEDIKQQVTAALEEQGVLASVKAQLRAAVFTALRDQWGSRSPSRNAQRDWLCSTEEGVSVAALVKEFLTWSGLQSTAKVFDAEFDPSEAFGTREELLEQLLVADASNQPLLLTILQSYLREQNTDSQLRRPAPGDVSANASPTYSRGVRAVAWRVGGEERFIKAVHVPGSPADKFEDAESDLSAPDAPDSGGVRESFRNLKLAYSGGAQSPVPPSETSPVFRNRVARSAEGELSPVRKSVEELKKQLLSQGLQVASAASSPERPRSPQFEKLVWGSTSPPRRSATSRGLDLPGV